MRSASMAAALVALALSVSASNFTGGDQVYVPAAARAR
jgi:hypothetical protein